MTAISFHPFDLTGTCGTCAVQIR